MSKEVYENLIILSRLLKNVEDKDLRNRYKLIEKMRGKYYPLEYDQTIAESANDKGYFDAGAGLEHEQNELFTKIVLLGRKGKVIPFDKAIRQFKEIMESSELSPL